MFTIATASQPEYDFQAPEYAKTAAGKLAKYQRRMARRKPTPGRFTSHGYKTAKKQAAACHKKVARQRQHTTLQCARKVDAAHQVIAVENFRTKFLFQTTMARKAADNAVGQAKRELISYAQRAGRTVVIVPPAGATMTRPPMLVESQDGPAVVATNFPVRLLRIHRRTRPERRQDDPGHGRARPHGVVPC